MIRLYFVINSDKHFCCLLKDEAISFRFVDQFEYNQTFVHHPPIWPRRTNINKSNVEQKVVKYYFQELDAGYIKKIM